MELGGIKQGLEIGGMRLTDSSVATGMQNKLKLNLGRVPEMDDSILSSQL